MGVGTALFVGASTLVGAGVGGVMSKAQGGSFWKGALVGGLTGAATGGLGAAAGASSSILPTALKAAVASSAVTGVASATGMTGSQSSGGMSKSAIESMASSNYEKSKVSPLTISELQQGNQNIYGTFGNTTSTFSRARLLNA